MKILFVCRSGGHGLPRDVVKAQADTIINQGVDVDYFLVKGRGISGYLSDLFRLKKFLKQKKYNIIHAHYSFSGILTSLSGAKNVIVSLMGSDVYNFKNLAFIYRLFARLFWKATIVKTEDMKHILGIKGVHVIPNGVNLNRFKPIDRIIAGKELGSKIPKEGKIIMFSGNEDRPEKNFELAKKVVSGIRSWKVSLIIPKGIEHSDMPLFLNACDLLLMTSVYEGSPNIVKEAVACNCPVVSTPVGDVKEILKGVDNSFVSTYEIDDLDDKVTRILASGSRSNGREYIRRYDSDVIALRIIELYGKVIGN